MPIGSKRFPPPRHCPAEENHGPALFSKPLGRLHHRTNQPSGQGVDACRRLRPICRPPPAVPRHRRLCGSWRRPWRRHRRPRQARDPPGHRRPRHARPHLVSSIRAVYHASTVLYPTAEDQVAHRARYQYGRRGTPTSEALEGAIAELEGEKCAGVALVPSGLAAISTALLSVAGSGDHILVTDSVYRPTRNFCDGLFKRLGVATTYYDPLIGAGIAKLLQPNTKAVFVEAPGSQSFEMQDIPAIAEVAHRQRRRRAHGQYLGNAALFSGTREGRRSVDPGRHQIYRRPFRHHVRLRVGECRAAAGAEDDDELARPLRRAGRHLSRAARLAHAQRAAGAAQQSGMRVARWLAQRPEVVRVLAPGAAKATPVTPSGSATSPAPADCSASCSSRRAKRRSTPS